MSNNSRALNAALVHPRQQQRDRRFKIESTQATAAAKSDEINAKCLEMFGARLDISLPP
jgi:hypothetical protein